MRRRLRHGHSLLELLVVVAISAILLMLATAGYAGVTRRAARHDVRVALWRVAAAQEHHRLAHGVYAHHFAGTAPAGADATEVLGPAPAAGGRWTLVLGGEREGEWHIEARPAGTRVDPDCAVLRLDHQGRATATDAQGTDATATCWWR